MAVCSSVRTIIASPNGCRFPRLLPQHSAAGTGRRRCWRWRRRVAAFAATLRGVVAHDRLDLEELVEAEFAPFAAVAGLLVAAEGRAEIGPGAVQMHIAGAQLRRHLARMLDVARLHI